MIVHTDREYGYLQLTENIKQLQQERPVGVEAFSIGQSVAGREIWCVRLGTGKHVVLYNGAHHSLEWITALLLMKFCALCTDAKKRGVRLAGYDMDAVFSYATIYLVPMVNPDGVELVLHGLPGDSPLYEQLVSYNHGNPDFSKTWQANLNGVDLNHNYDADFHLSREAEQALGIYGPNHTRYAGPRPFSEPETRALAQFVAQVAPRLAAAYHSQGEVIYYGFKGKEPKETLVLGRLLEKETGYQLDVPEGIASFGGFKDWFTDQYRRPGYTIEVGLGKNPLPIEQFDSILSQNLSGFLLMAMA